MGITYLILIDIYILKLEIIILFIVSYIISYHLFSFHKSVQDYIIHMDMEIVIFVGIKG